MATEAQIELDFGDPTLNDPDYEQKVQDDGTLTEQTPDGAQQGGTEVPSGEQQQPPAEQDGAQGGQGGDTDTARQSQPQQGQAPDATKTRADDKGNIVDQHGNVIAQSGAERRHFERAQAQAQYISRLERDLEQARAERTDMNVLDGLPRQLGLERSDVELGLQAIKSFKTDPVSTARWMLQETMRMGYNLNQIIGETADGQLNSGSLDMNAVRGMISEAVQPLVQDRTAQMQQATAEQEAQREYEGFVAKHEHANVHEDVLANMLRQDKTLSPEAAYWQLREYVARNGLDFAQPLAPQVQARQQGAQPQQQQQQQPAPSGNAPQQAPQPQQPMPHGGAPMNDLQTQGAFAAPDDRWDDIVNQSMREAGLT